MIEASMPIRIAIVEDVAELRQEITMLFRRHPDLELVGEFADAESAMAQLVTIHPDIVLMDIQLPAMLGVECVRKLKPLLPNAQIMMLTVFDDYERIFQSLQAGASGYLLKKSIPTKLLESIRELYAGGSPMSPSIARKVVQAFNQPAPPMVDALLSAREREILSALAQGKLYKEIGVELGLSFHTVRTHVNNIYKKLQVRTRGAAVKKATTRSSDAEPPRHSEARPMNPRSEQGDRQA